MRVHCLHSHSRSGQKLNIPWFPAAKSASLGACKNHFFASVFVVPLLVVPLRFCWSLHNTFSVTRVTCDVRATLPLVVPRDTGRPGAGDRVEHLPQERRSDALGTKSTVDHTVENAENARECLPPLNRGRLRLQGPSTLP